MAEPTPTTCDHRWEILGGTLRLREQTHPVQGHTLAVTCVVCERALAQRGFREVTAWDGDTPKAWRTRAPTYHEATSEAQRIGWIWDRMDQAAAEALAEATQREGGAS